MNATIETKTGRGLALFGTHAFPASEVSPDVCRRRTRTGHPSRRAPEISGRPSRNHRQHGRGLIPPDGARSPRSAMPTPQKVSGASIPPSQLSLRWLSG